jgi:hypothetical protein
MPENAGLRLKIAQACIFALLSAGWSAAGADNLPVTSAETLAGQKLEFPTALAGKPAVCVFGFSKEAGDRTKVWMNRLTQDGINAWSVANLEGAPALVRGMIRGSMRKGTPQAQLARSLIMTKDEKAWKLAVGATQDSLPLVVVFDSSTQIQWKYEGLFGDEPYLELKTRLERAVVAAVK